MFDVVVLVGVGSSSAICTSNVTKTEGECSTLLRKQLIYVRVDLL
jgi:hypothetical protein